VSNARDGWMVVVSELDKKSEPAYAVAR